MKVPEVFPASVVNAALFPAGRAEVFAVKDATASPSGSDAETVKLISDCSDPLAVPGAVTEGARSTLATVTAVEAEPESAFEAVKVTV